MQLAIVAENEIVCVDGVGRTLNFEIDPNILAVQWNGDFGFVEQKVGGTRKIKDLSEFQRIIDAYKAAILEESKVTVSKVSLMIDAELQKVFKSGIYWRETEDSDLHNLSLTPNMRVFLQNTHNLLTAGHISPHSGEVWQDDRRFAISDPGLKELCEFAGLWGLKMVQKSKTEVGLIKDMNETELEEYALNSIKTINWDTTWPPEKIGWLNNIITHSL